MKKSKSSLSGPKQDSTVAAKHAAGSLQQMMQQAMAALYGRDWAKAEQLCRTVLAAKPDYFDALNLLGAITAQSGRLQEAADLLGRAVAVRPDNAEAFSNRGNVLQELRQFGAAVASYDRAIAIRPALADAHNNRGIALAELNRPGDAVASYDRAIAIKPDYAEAHSNRGNALKALGQYEAAVASFDRAIGCRPDFAEAFGNRGLAQQELKLPEAALESFNRAIELRHDFAEAFSNRGNVQQELRQFDAAIASYDRALAIRPDYADAYNNRGIALAALNRLDEAMSSYDRAIAIKPDYAEAYSNRGNALKELGQFEAAVASYDRAVGIRPGFAEACSNRGVALKELRRFDEAIASCDSAIALRANYAEAFYNRGNVFAELNRLDEAIANYDEAIRIRPGYADAYVDKAIALLLGGNLEQGFELYEWRWEKDEARRYRQHFAQPLWLGRESLQGKTILLHSEQGLGDTIQFCRYAKLVAERGARVVLSVPRSLVSLFRGLAGVAQLVVAGDPLPPFDYHCPLLSLPLACGTRIDNIPAATRYIFENGGKLDTWRGKLGDKTAPRIGIAWSSLSNFKGDRSRSVSLSDFLKALPDSGYEYVCLQKELRDGDKPTLAANPQLRYFGDALEDFTDTAALIDCLDLVVSTCTSVPHLSCAMGKPTWILLKSYPDWRWMLGRNDSPWYPTARLLRQEKPGDWDGVFARVRDELASGRFGMRNGN